MPDFQAGVQRGPPEQRVRNVIGMKIASAPCRVVGASGCGRPLGPGAVTPRCRRLGYLRLQPCLSNPPRFQHLARPSQGHSHCYENSPGSHHTVVPAKAGTHGGERRRVRPTCTTPNRQATPHFHHLVRPSQGHSDSERSKCHSSENSPPGRPHPHSSYRRRPVPRGAGFRQYLGHVNPQTGSRRQ